KILTQIQLYYGAKGIIFNVNRRKMTSIYKYGLSPTIKKIISFLLLNLTIAIIDVTIKITDSV
ncbi:hypothetical protein, partial [Vagococcus silagei]|uniref:hypothetical protein n=1 Tax=Vagococcus silagei TaxID=2508885 RepID=UPI00195239C6